MLQMQQWASFPRLNESYLLVFILAHYKSWKIVQMLSAHAEGILGVGVQLFCSSVLWFAGSAKSCGTVSGWDYLSKGKYPTKWLCGEADPTVKHFIDACKLIIPVSSNLYVDSVGCLSQQEWRQTGMLGSETPLLCAEEHQKESGKISY